MPVSQKISQGLNYALICKYCIAHCVYYITVCVSASLLMICICISLQVAVTMR
jgi:hypothetical protein